VTHPRRRSTKTGARGEERLEQQVYRVRARSVVVLRRPPEPAQATEEDR